MSFDSMTGAIRSQLISRANRDIRPRSDVNDLMPPSSWSSDNIAIVDFGVMLAINAAVGLHRKDHLTFATSRELRMRRSMFTL